MTPSPSAADKLSAPKVEFSHGKLEAQREPLAVIDAKDAQGIDHAASPQVASKSNETGRIEVPSVPSSPLLSFDSTTPAVLPVKDARE